MPRTGKGGKRQGDAQTAYSNRTDLNNRGPQPITAAPGQPYGQRQMLEDAQRAVPMAGTSVPAAQISKSNLPAVQQNLPGPGEIPFREPMPHPDQNVPPAISNDPNTVRNIADILSEAASSNYATEAVKNLASFARAMVV